MTAAFNELAAGEVRQRNFAKAVETAETSEPTTEQRDAVLSRIDRIGKGRYAQRLAAHVTVMNLRARVCELLNIDGDAPVDRGDLVQISGCGVLLALLDDLRRNIEGLPLLPTEEQHSEWHSRFEDDRADGDDHDSADGGQDTGNNGEARRVQQRR
jgi:putative ATP-dependent endonuclease of OLD family